MNDKNVAFISDKTHVPYLLSISSLGTIKYLGYQVNAGKLLFKFSPKNKTKELIDQFDLRTAPMVQPAVLFSSIELFWRTVNNER